MKYHFYLLYICLSISYNSTNNGYHLGSHNSREGARSNPIDEVKARYNAVETFALRGFPIEQFIKLSYGGGCLISVDCGSPNILSFQIICQIFHLLNLQMPLRQPK